MLLYLIREQGSYFEPKNLFTSNKELTHKEVIKAINDLFDVKFVDVGDFMIVMNEKTHNIFYEKVKDPLKLFKVAHLEQP